MADKKPDSPARSPPADGAAPAETRVEHASDPISVASLRSSILQYHEENGRTYHALSAGKYVLPNDESEQERLDILNHLFFLTYDGRYCLCPKNEGAKRVLDMGTGTGMWAIDYADAHPDAEVIGVDLSPIQPSFVPPNCSFEIDDLEKDWTWTKKFDLIFARGMSGTFADWPSIMTKAYNQLEPGGYFELHNTLFPIACDDGTLDKDSYLVKWSDFMEEGTSKLGRKVNQSKYYPGWLQEAGFVDITTQIFKWPTNRWPRDKKYKELGMWGLAAADPGLEGISMAVFTRGLGWSKEETFAFCTAVRKELRSTKIHAYWNM
ncbi:S-adenosyl-L-methionine-dependent methyltransferase [Thozetella sp. PMI_491]|nr:S-adenosyl-L-methionine-dependent methyltransferase [Thozetella sp. PMI_491]